MKNTPGTAHRSKEAQESLRAKRTRYRKRKKYRIYHPPAPETKEEKGIPKTLDELATMLGLKPNE